MKLSTKSRYGVRMLLDMALHQDLPHSNLADIAQRQDISPRYLEQIAAELKRNGIVKSVRGAHGGYHLNIPPENIVLKDILDILEGDLLVVEEEESFSLIERFLQENVFTPLSEIITGYLCDITLQQMVDKARFGKEALMYYL